MLGKSTGTFQRAEGWGRGGSPSWDLRRLLGAAADHSQQRSWFGRRVEEESEQVSPGQRVMGLGRVWEERVGGGGPRRRGAAAGRPAPCRLDRPGIGLRGLPAGCGRSPMAHCAGRRGETAYTGRGLPAAPGAASAEAAEDSKAPRGREHLLQPGGHPGHPPPPTQAPRVPRPRLPSAGTWRRHCGSDAR